ncbi:uncharacterized protein LOC100377716 [Saccoglossus kowalevskii]|uniref:Tripartite motif-containing protein 2-like n=1 Tax=Saccoglossus kowalevskii TaxID=10224 RepID=A0ABM0GLQ2_SACKO|nr:PREDICTED: tripartite motif-containing protein 2-like [Saccoglossus kowalevskii]
MAAAKRSTTLDQIDDQYLTCSICFERFNNAKILPCQHSFCELCLLKWVNKHRQDRCPVCRHKCQLSTSRIRKLPSSLLINGVIGIIEAREKQLRGGPCDGCLNNPSSNRCVDCAMFLCRNCSMAHKYKPVSRNHHTMTTDQYQQARLKDPSIAQLAVNCTAHNDKVIEFYCETCQIPTCGSCIRQIHREHVLVDINHAADEVRVLATEKITSLKTKVTQARVSRERTMEHVGELDREYNKQVERIKLHAKKTRISIFKKLKQLEQSHLEHLKRSRDQINGELDTHLHTHEQVEELVTSTLTFTESLLQHSSSALLMKTSKETTNQLDTMAEIDTVFKLHRKTLPTFCPADVTIKGTLGSFSHVAQCELETMSGSGSTAGSHKGLESGKIEIEISRAKPISSQQELQTRPGRERDLLEQTLESDYAGDNDIKSDHSESITSAPSSNEESSTSQTRFDTMIETRSDVTLHSELCLEKSLGTYGEGSGNFNWPLGVTVTAHGDIAVADQRNYRVQIIDRNGKEKMSIHNEGTVTFFGIKKSYPIDVAISKDGRYLITDGNKAYSGKTSLRFRKTEGCNFNQVLVCNQSGRLISCFGKNELRNPCGIAISDSRKLAYIVDESANCVLVYETDSYTYVKSFGKGHLHGPTFIAVNNKDDIIVSDTHHHCVKVFNCEGELSFSFGSRGSEDGKFLYPFGVATDNHGNIYVCDYGNSRIVIFDFRGELITSIKEVPWPTGIAVTGDVPCKIVVTTECVQIYA